MGELHFKINNNDKVTHDINELLKKEECSGSTIVFSKGEYLVDTINLQSNIHIRGEIGTTFKLKESSNVLFRIENLDNVIIENINLIYNDENNVLKSEDKIGIKITNSRRISIKDVYIKGFNNSGIYVDNQGYKEQKDYSSNTFIINSRIEKCYYGLHFGYRGEYCNIIGVTCGENNIGCFNVGGNNIFSNCHFNNNVIGYVLEGGIEYPNNSHSSMTSCQFNHNKSHALFCRNVNNGFIFSGCQFFDGKLEFEGDTNGIMFTGCEGGSWEHIANHSGDVVFIGCFFQKDPRKSGARSNNIRYINNVTSMGLDCIEGIGIDGDIIRMKGSHGYIGCGISKEKLRKFLNLTE